MDINSQLKELKLTIAEKEHIEAKLEALKSRERVIGSEVIELRRIMEYECADVEKLENLGAVSLFYSLIGKKVEKLDVEKREAVLATEKYKLAVAELEDISRDIEKCERELRNIKRCEKKYAELWKLAVDKKVEDETEVKYDGELARLKEQLIETEVRLKNTDEAISEGDKLFSLGDEISELIHEYIEVNGAQRKHTPAYELIEAHEKLKRADNMLRHLNGQISRFRAELADVDLGFDMQHDSYEYSIVGASNYYADRFVASEGSRYEVLREIRKLKAELGNILHRLEQRRERLQKNAESIEEKINKIISL